MNRNKGIEAFRKGISLEAYRWFGAHFVYEEVPGVRFTVWAEHARSVQVIGEFNEWGRQPVWLERVTAGIFSGFVAGVKEDCMYRYLIEDAYGNWHYKSDPFAFFSELRPNNASIVFDLDDYLWHDQQWIKNRTLNFDQPLNIYEVHAGAWCKDEEDNWLNYTELAKLLIPYVKKNGFTHVELMPLNEHPYDGSWGYQSSGYFSCTSRYGTPKQFMEFVDAAHQAGIGVIMDIVPIHFAKDEHGLKCFDGTSQYEYNQTEKAMSEWGTAYFDLGKEEVRSFLMSSAAFWCDVYHVDGLRVDAVSHMIYHHGNCEFQENNAGLGFIKQMNQQLKRRFPEVMLIAEDSTAYPYVTKSVEEGGLGFDYKWDLGWMNDTLRYYQRDPASRKYHHHDITFSMAYFHSERFLLPLSHDEVVHGKNTIVNKMWGDYDQKFSQARNLYLYMFTHPGKKLNFMGNEIAMMREFDEKRENDWVLLKYPRHDAFSVYFYDLCHMIKNESVFHDDYPSNFRWIDADCAEHSIYSYYRENEKNIFIIVLNMMPIAHEGYRLGVPYFLDYIEIINTESGKYDGLNWCNEEVLVSKEIPMNNMNYSVKLNLAPFAGIVLKANKLSKP